MTLADRIEETIKRILDKNPRLSNQKLAEMIRFHVAQDIQSDALQQRYEAAAATPMTTRYFDDQ